MIKKEVVDKGNVLGSCCCENIQRKTALKERKRENTLYSPYRPGGSLAEQTRGEFVNYQ